MQGPRWAPLCRPIQGFLPFSRQSPASAYISISRDANCDLASGQVSRKGRLPEAVLPSTAASSESDTPAHACGTSNPPPSASSPGALNKQARLPSPSSRLLGARGKIKNGPGRPCSHASASQPCLRGRPGRGCPSANLTFISQLLPLLRRPASPLEQVWVNDSRTGSFTRLGFSRLVFVFSVLGRYFKANLSAVICQH